MKGGPPHTSKIHDTENIANTQMYFHENFKYASVTYIF